MSAIRVCEGDEYTLSFSAGNIEASAQAVPASPPDTALHEVSVYFDTSSEGDGFYLALLDGQPIDMGESISSIDPSGDCARIDPRLLGTGEPVEGTTEIRFEGVSLGESLEPVLP